jgi:hypothetical protein
MAGSNAACAAPEQAQCLLYSFQRGVSDLHLQEPPKVVTLETVAALLDGATPLHCAALRGNPSQVSKGRLTEFQCDGGGRGC